MLAFRQMKPGTNHFFYDIHRTSKMPAAMKNINGAFFKLLLFTGARQCKRWDPFHFCFLSLCKNQLTKGIQCNYQWSRNT